MNLYCGLHNGLLALVCATYYFGHYVFPVMNSYVGHERVGGRKSEDLQSEEFVCDLANRLTEATQPASRQVLGNFHF